MLSPVAPGPDAAGLSRPLRQHLGRRPADDLDLDGGAGPVLQPRFEPIRPLLESQVGAWQAQGARRRFIVAVPPNLPPLLVDRDAVERILTNLVSNAVKYSPAGSEIRLVARAAGGASVEVSVEDEGEGIPEDALPRIFDLYYRVARRNSAARGLGLGLALVRSLVEANGGTIRVESSTGTGSRFTVSLPCGS